MRLNITDIVSEWVENELELPFTIYSDLIPDEDNDGACLRHDPAPAAEKRFTDGTRQVTWNLTFYVRCKNSVDALAYAKDITDKLDGATVTSDGTKIDCEATTLPQFIDMDAKGFTTYSASIKCTYLEELEA